jgi:hypothetical protein
MGREGEEKLLIEAPLTKEKRTRLLGFCSRAGRGCCSVSRLGFGPGRRVRRLGWSWQWRWAESRQSG